jgi:hypothetical protein
MGKRLTIHVPQRIWRRVVRIAQKTDATPRALATAMMLRALDKRTLDEEADDR